MMDWLRDVEPKRIRAAMIESLRGLRKQPPKRRMYSYSDVIKRFVPIVLPNSDASAHAQIAHKIIEQQSGEDSGDEWPDNARISSAIWHLISLGAIYPRLRRVNQDGYPTVIEHVVIGPGFDRLFTEDIHPLHPEFIDRLQAKWPSIPDEPASRFADAAACLARGLTRAAVVMIGLATEEVVREAHSRVVAGKASKHIVLRDQLDDLELVATKNDKPDERHVLQAALAAAEVVRIERNKASHPGAVFDDPIVAEELILSSSRHLPVIWSLWVAPK